MNGYECDGTVIFIRLKIKVRVPFVEMFCIEKDSYIDAIKCENSFKLCIFIPK